MVPLLQNQAGGDGSKTESNVLARNRQWLVNTTSSHRRRHRPPRPYPVFDRHGAKRTDADTPPSCGDVLLLDDDDDQQHDQHHRGRRRRRRRPRSSPGRPAVSSFVDGAVVDQQHQIVAVPYRDVLTSKRPRRRRRPRSRSRSPTAQIIMRRSVVVDDGFIIKEGANSHRPAL